MDYNLTRDCGEYVLSFGRIVDVENIFIIITKRTKA